jgi:predicted MFS family arabinose efflux permease
VERRASFPDAPALTVLFLVNVLNYYDRQALGALVEPLRHQFHLSDTQLAAIPTLATVVYAVAGVPLGRLADRVSRRRLLAAGVAVWALLTGFGALASSYAMLLVSRLGVGTGEAVCAPAATSWIGDLVPAHRRARAMAGFMMAVPVGVMLSLAVSGPVAQRWGWRTALTVASLPAVVLVPALLCLREPARGAAPAAASFAFLRLPAFWWIAASGAIVNSALYSFSYFLPAFLTRFHGLAVGQAGLWTGIGSGAAGILGAVSVAVFGDRAARHRPGGRMLLAGTAAALAVAPAALAIALPAGHAVAAVWLAMAGYALLQTYYGLVYAALHDVVAPTWRGAAMSVYLLVTYLCGASFGPLLTGRLSDRFARAAAGAAAVTEAAKASGLRQAMYIVPVLSALLAMVLWAGAAAAKTGRQAA